MIRNRLLKSIRGHEGERLKAYKCPAGFWTIGYGTNLEVLEIDQQLAERLLQDEVEKLWLALCDVEGFSGISAIRQDVIIEMAYQLGLAGCLNFKKMWAAIREGDFWAAASEMLDSRWAIEQTPSRAEKLASRMRNGSWSGLPGDVT